MLKNILIFTISVFVISCTPLKKQKYLQNIPVDTTKSATKEKEINATYRIQKGDNLYVSLFSFDKLSNEAFNPSVNPNAFNTPQGIYLNSYTVNDSGCINFPILKQLNVEKLTIAQATSLITSKLDTYLKDFTITVKLATFPVTVLGDVNRPGTFPVNDSKINIFEALGLAGDINVYGNKEKISIIRKLENGTNEVIYLNILDKNIINSPYFYLRPNDVVYVEPLKTKQFGFATFPTQVVLTAITTLILVLNYIKK